MNRPETHIGGLFFSVGKTPVTGVGIPFGMLTVSQELQVVVNVLAAIRVGSFFACVLCRACQLFTSYFCFFTSYA